MHSPSTALWTLLLLVAGAAGTSAVATADDADRGETDRRLGALERRNAELERGNQELRRRLDALEVGTPGVRTGTGALRPEPQAEPMSAGSALPPGLTVGAGSAEVTFRLFGHTAFQYQARRGSGSDAAFAIGLLDLFTTARAGDHLQVLAEIVAETEVETGGSEATIEPERLWGRWSFSDALYLKLGREHAPISRWNRRFHHGRWGWTSATAPFLARFEDECGLLPLHLVGIEAGGAIAAGAGGIDWVAAVSNGRSSEHDRVQDVVDQNAHKAIDLALGFSPAALPELHLGGALHWDEVPANPADPARARDMGEVIASGHLELETGRLELLSEVAWIAHRDRVARLVREHLAWYVQAGWRIEPLTVYTRFDQREMSRGDPFYGATAADLDRWEQVLGVRWDLGDHACLKLEGSLGRGERRGLGGSVERGPVSSVEVQFAWGF